MIKKKIKQSNKNLNIVEIKSRYNVFVKNMRNLKDMLEKIEKNKLSFYGASQMLPVILYHLKFNINLVKS